jgi:hypothetical protein
MYKVITEMGYSQSIKMFTALLLGGFGAFLVYQGKTEAGMAAAGAAATIATIQQDKKTDNDDLEKLRQEREILALENEIARLKYIQEIHKFDIDKEIYRLKEIHELELKNRDLELRLEMAEREKQLALHNRGSNALLPPTSPQNKDNLLPDALPATTEPEIVDNMDEESHNKDNDAHG